MPKVSSYIKEMRQEMLKVHWPNKRELASHSALVVGASIGVAAFIGIVDYLFTLGFEWILRVS